MKKRLISLTILSLTVLIVLGNILYLPIGNIILEIEESHSLNETLVGEVKIVIQEENLIPKDTEILLSLNEKKVSMTFEEFIDGQIDYVEVPETIENCQRGVLEEESNLNCVNKTITNYFYNTPGTYSRNLNDLIDYVFTESGDYILTLSIPSLDLFEEKNFNIEPTEQIVEISNTKTFSSDRTILAAPTQSTPILNSTSGINYSSDNLTCYNQSTSDGDLDTIKNIYNWYRNGTSITLLNLPFEGGSNSTYTKDYSGYNYNTQVLVGATWNATGGYDGKGAYDFDGITGGLNISLAEANLLHLKGDNYTIAAWLYTRSFGGGNDGRIVQFGNGGSEGYFFQVENDSGEQTFKAFHAGAITITFQSDLVNLNTWQHVALAYSNPTVKLYIDGVLVNETAMGPVSADSTINDFYIGRRANGVPFDGIIDEFMMFNFSLSGKQISAMYNNQTNLIVSQETTSYQNWSCAVTPNDGTQDGTTLISNNLTIADSTPPIITFNYQLPADIDSLNSESTDNVNVTYNITDINGVNASTILIYSKSNSSLDNIAFYINGTATSGYQPFSGTNTSSTWFFAIRDEKIFPSSYNIDDQIMEDTTHNESPLNTTREVKVRFFNISNTRQYNYIEAMVNSSALTNSLKFYYCNETYTTGSVLTDNNCFDFYTLAPIGTYNYTHNLSSYQIIPFAINTTTGMIGDVYVTPTSYIIARVVTADSWKYYSVPIVSRSDTIQTSIDEGISWQNELSTVDMNFHQFSGNDTFYYYVCANDTLRNGNCSAVRNDLLQLAGLPPISPSIYNPFTETHIGNITINYTASLSPNNYAMDFYNISLLNSDESYNSTITTNNSLNLSYIWDSTGTPYGDYIIRVDVCDVINQCSFGISEIFSINDLEPNVTLSYPPTTTGTTIYYPNKMNLEEGYTRVLGENWKFEFYYLGFKHMITVNKIYAENKTAIITVQSDPQTKEISLGEEWLINLDQDNYLDLKIVLEDIVGNTAKIYIKIINQSIEEEKTEEKQTEEEKTEEKQTEEPYNPKIIIAAIITLVIIISAYLYLKRKK